MSHSSTRPHLLLLPGLLCDEALWHHQLNELATDVTMTVADMGRCETMTDMAHSVLQQAPARFSLAGLSMGGYCALEIMRQAPERVERLALLDTSARSDTPEQTQRRNYLIALSQRGNFRGVSTFLMPLFLHESRLADKTLVNDVVAMTRRVGAEAFVQQQKAIINRVDSRPNLAAIHCPTLVLCGRQDRLTTLELHEEIATTIPTAELTVIEQCGHLSTLERPQEVNQALKKWLMS